jgi:flagellar basal-body rod protein FlgF
MIKGIQTAETAMRPKMARMEVIANNLANVNTTGFKRDRLFVQMLNDSVGGKTDAAGDLDGVRVTEGVDFSEGSLRQTGNPLDVAIQGRGFFAVNTPGGVRFTRNGSFRLSADGSLVNTDGYQVEGTGGAIRFPGIEKLQQATVSIAETGEVLIDKDPIGRLRIVEFADTSVLSKESASLFSAAPGALMTEGSSSSAVKQGVLEESNVDGVEEMIAMTELQRSFDTDQKVLQALDDSVAKSLDVGRL